MYNFQSNAHVVYVVSIHVVYCCQSNQSVYIECCKRSGHSEAFNKSMYIKWCKSCVQLSADNYWECVQECCKRSCCISRQSKWMLQTHVVYYCQSKCVDVATLILQTSVKMYGMVQTPMLLYNSCQSTSRTGMLQAPILHFIIIYHVNQSVYLECCER